MVAPISAILHRAAGAAGVVVHMICSRGCCPGALEGRIRRGIHRTEKLGGQGGGRSNIVGTGKRIGAAGCDTTGEVRRGASGGRHLRLTVAIALNWEGNCRLRFVCAEGCLGMIWWILRERFLQIGVICRI
jgi:hypothetical protein